MSENIIFGRDLNTIQGEFGGSNPISINEYYRSTWNTGSGVIVPPFPGATSTGSNTQPIPASGQISLNNFYGTCRGVKVDLIYYYNVLYSDPYYQVTAYSAFDLNYPIGDGMNLRYINSEQDIQSGGVRTYIEVYNNESARVSGGFVNFLNGRIRLISNCFSKTYFPLYNVTQFQWLEGNEVDGVGSGAAAVYPNDGVTTLAFNGNPLGFYSSTFNPAQAINNYYSSFIIFDDNL